jgi:TolA-binding protein
MAELEQRCGNPTLARRNFEEALKIKRDIEDHSGAADILLRLGQMSESEGNLTQASRLYAESCQIYQRLRTLNTPEGQICAESLARVRQILR